MSKMSRVRRRHLLLCKLRIVRIPRLRLPKLRIRRWHLRLRIRVPWLLLAVLRSRFRHLRLAKLRRRWVRHWRLSELWVRRRRHLLEWRLRRIRSELAVGIGAWSAALWSGAILTGGVERLDTRVARLRRRSAKLIGIEGWWLHTRGIAWRIAWSSAALSVGVKWWWHAWVAAGLWEVGLSGWHLWSWRCNRRSCRWRVILLRCLLLRRFRSLLRPRRLPCFQVEVSNDTQLQQRKSTYLPPGPLSAAEPSPGPMILAKVLNLPTIGPCDCPEYISDMYPVDSSCVAGSASFIRVSISLCSWPNLSMGSVSLFCLSFTACILVFQPSFF
jgi:hypothetical protein